MTVLVGEFAKSHVKRDIIGRYRLSFCFYYEYYVFA